MVFLILVSCIPEMAENRRFSGHPFPTKNSNGAVFRSIYTVVYTLEPVYIGKNQAEREVMK
jgi:hypothetical protein